MCHFLWFIALLGSICSSLAQAFPPPKNLGDTNSYGYGIQRAMRLMAASTPEKRNTVKVLFYGQSITEQRWSNLVADDLKRRFPNANLIIENRAIGGFASQLLVKTAEMDLYPFYPDLLIFHVYGSHIEYENIIKRVRERTTAEVLIQTDHITKDDQIDEETDSSKLTPKSWDAFMNHSFLPGTARKYGAELLDQRTLWIHYLKDNHLHAADLLKDGVHLNAHGEFLMAEFVKAHLRYDPKLANPKDEAMVRTVELGKEAGWKNGKLTMKFEGNRVDAVTAPGASKTFKVLIDGRKPSEFSELYGFTRTTAYPGSKWPCLLRVTSQKPLQIEEWTLSLTDYQDDMKHFKFALEGSSTGSDGEGTSNKKFGSNSGRVVIDPADWNFDYALKVFKKPLPKNFKIQWKVVPYFQDEFASKAVKDRSIEQTVTLVQGLPNGHHTLQLSGADETGVTAIRVYRPPFGGSGK
jgi:hypothetical protein